MLIFDENCDTIVIDNLNGPVVTEYMYVLDLSILDYTLVPITYIEEAICKTVSLSVYGFEFNVPASMTVLIADEETTQLDVVKVYDIAGKSFKAVVYDTEKEKIELCPIRLWDYHDEWCNIYPSLNRNQMLCHPISATKWLNIGTSDVYNKYLKNKLTGDLV